MDLPVLDDIFAVRFYERLRTPRAEEVAAKDDLIRTVCPQWMGMTKVTEDGRITTRELTEAEIEETVTSLREKFMNEDEILANVVLKNGEIVRFTHENGARDLKIRMMMNDACLGFQTIEASGLNAESVVVNSRNLREIARLSPTSVMFHSHRIDDKPACNISWQCSVEELEVLLAEQGFAFNKDDEGAKHGFVFFTEIQPAAAAPVLTLNKRNHG